MQSSINVSRTCIKAGMRLERCSTSSKLEEGEEKGELLTGSHSTADGGKITIVNY
jgi:hypothetical protein